MEGLAGVRSVRREHVPRPAAKGPPVGVGTIPCEKKLRNEADFELAPMPKAYGFSGLAEVRTLMKEMRNEANFRARASDADVPRPLSPEDLFERLDRPSSGWSSGR
jgi:hypothetical protein